MSIASIYDRLQLLEKACEGDCNNLTAQVQELSKQVDKLLANSGAEALDYGRLAALLTVANATADATTGATGAAALSSDSKRAIVEARASEVLEATRQVHGDGTVPEVEIFQVDELRQQVEQTIHLFDETTTRNAHVARIYLDRLNRRP